jgi:serpin B
MKKLLIVLVFLSILFTSGCDKINDLISGEETEGEGYIKSKLSRETSPEVDTSQIGAIASGNTEFALSFYDKINEDAGNIVFSPFSISLALSMALAGAEGTTETGMLEALQFTLPEAEIHPAFNALLLEIEESQQGANNKDKDDEFKLNIANSIWGQSGFDFKEDFLDTLALNYGAGMYSVDFKEYPDDARVAINDWVEKETEEKIKDLIPAGAINPLTRLVLANAIYFNGSWLYPFDEENTHDAEFALLDGSTTTVDMMGLAGESFSYLQGENYQTVQLPYFSTDFVMTLIVPDNGAFTEVENALDVEMLNEVLNNVSMQPVDLQMPKYDFETTVNANTPLSALGMVEAFDVDKADFSSITNEEELYITDVLHKATITVDEGGTEAAAATAIIFGIKSAMPEEAISLVIDRPFLFFIQHVPTGTVLFMGRVTQP